MEVRNVYLVGMMAVGKTTIGRQLASRLGFTFHDTDHAVEEQAGADISWIFELEGEAGFRDREQQAIDDFTGHDGVVLATGGGAVLRGHNRARLRERGTVVYLECDVDLIVERTRSDSKRPLLQVDDVRKRIEAISTERAPLYKAAAHFSVPVDRRPPKAITADIVHLLSAEDERVLHSGTHAGRAGRRKES